MTHLENFKRIHGPGISCRKAVKEKILFYKDKLPASLIELWEDEGWCGYAKGFIWVVDPPDYTDIINEWLKIPSKIFYVFARSAFGDMFLWCNNEAYYLNVHHDKIKRITDDIEIVFNSVLCDSVVLERLLLMKLYQDALPRLGQPKYDECYAFVPALALGGPGTADSLQKVKLHEHLGLLAQLMGK